MFFLDGTGFFALVGLVTQCGMASISVHDHLQRIAPRVLQRFVFITGDLASPAAADFAARCSRPLLKKPFDLDRLFREVAAVARSA